jgi:hypothetical protein
MSASIFAITSLPRHLSWCAVAIDGDRALALVELDERYAGRRARRDGRRRRDRAGDEAAREHERPQRRLVETIAARRLAVLELAVDAVLGHELRHRARRLRVQVLPRHGGEIVAQGAELVGVEAPRRRGRRLRAVVLERPRAVGPDMGRRDLRVGLACDDVDLEQRGRSHARGIVGACSGG